MTQKQLEAGHRSRAEDEWQLSSVKKHRTVYDGRLSLMAKAPHGVRTPKEKYGAFMWTSIKISLIEMKSSP